MKNPLLPHQPVCSDLLRWILVWFLLSISAQGLAQIVDYGQNPPSLSWNKIISTHFKVIFPEELGNRAERLVNVLERIYFVENHSLQVKTQPITIILQNQPVRSNAFVLLSPRRSEFNTLPPQDLEPLDWLNSLAVHEMRHVVQMDRVFNGKETKIFETIQLGIFGLVYPAWFFEGDAVDMETILSEGGRGRLPSWDIDLRANLLSNKNYSYSKYTLGSWKDNIPDYYRIGYFMVTKMRRDFGDSVFNKIYGEALRLAPFPLSRSLKRNTGTNTRSFYYKTVKELKNKWIDSLHKSQVLYYPPLNARRDSIPRDFLLPKPFIHHEILFLKQGLDLVSAIYRLDTKTGVENKVIELGPQTSPNFDYKKGKLVWDETRTDPRFAYRGYSNLLVYDLVTHTKNRITSKTKLFSPSFHPDGNSVVAVRVKTDYTFNLVILEILKPREILDLPNPHHYFFETPSFNFQGNKLVCIAVNSYGKAIYEYDLLKKSETLLKPFSRQEINRPVYSTDGHILYQSSATGRDQIWCLDTSSKKELALTATPYGAYSPSFQGDTLWFENFSALGKNISLCKFSTEIKVPKDTVNRFINYAQPLVKGELGGKSEFYKIINQITEDSSLYQNSNSNRRDSLVKFYPSTRFREIGHLFYFHSLLPDVQNYNLNSTTYLSGLRLTSTNLLNTTQTYLGIYYQNGVNAVEYQAGITYKKFFPEILFNFVDKKRNALAIEAQKAGNVYLPYSYRSRILNLGVLVPLNFNSSVDNYTVNFQINTSFQNNYDLTIPLARFTNFNTYIKFPLHYTFLFEKDKRTSMRDIYPKWGQNISLDFEHLPFSNNLKGHYFAMNSAFYIPGIISHQALRIGFNYQFYTGAYQGQRSIDEINGFEYLPANLLQNTLLVNYYFPIVYPDWELGPLAYLRRIIGGVFYDRENVALHSQTFSSFTTYGASLRIDFNLLRYYLPVFQWVTKLIIFDGSSLPGPKIQFSLNYSL